MKNKYCLALDIKNDPESIAAYDRYHENVWPEIKKSITDAGILNMEIYRTGNRLFMIIDVEEGFSFERKAALDGSNPKVQEWEDLMWNYLQRLDPAAERGWVLMDRVFSLKD
ncbi:L-rhamnose mutarotase [Paraflavisolibacter sp. H34]|uniref:L-rhamnose mutarotase n=1 Tax=Huijunlia imazamoxiresistens TaxID=3127457 RepID=UPI0030173EB6